MKLVELFCGTGGFSRGAHAAGFNVTCAYDIDPILTSSYRLNFPATKLYLRDISSLTGAEIERDVAGEVFGVFGGPPCQGFSDMGRRDISDPRRDLLGHFFRVVSELQPCFFIMENVRGLSYPDALPVLNDALDQVRKDYDLTEPWIWNAADFGAATNRNRLFVVGVRKDLRTPFLWEDLDAFRRTAATVQQALADLDRPERLPDCESHPGFDQWKITKRGPPSDYARGIRSRDRKFTGHLPTAHTEKVVERFAKVRPGRMDTIGRHPRLKLTGQCPTLRAGTGSDKGSYQAVRPIHPIFHRVITVREGARLQGFPDNHLFHPTIWHSFRMIGNSVSPVMAEAIFSAVRDRLGLEVGEAVNVMAEAAE
ncbi:DNA cytosine methyltransferase [Novosphingobium sp. AP12]|uniref:DNA cytosine methyltransferase n=1 Tax=Novosphingobium sp. AP12 TaxID=1144305 RepID=UPI000272107A|nr:DNA cytosine methyltransferase [Novosphingobium sp. AP12]EJL22429.1 DNA-methyltransferase Dcm [Novosphingobium sp. AP12]